MLLGGFPTVSLDKIYLTCDEETILFLDCTRLDGEETIVSRRSANDLVNVDKQINLIAQKLIDIGQRQIILADDVVFSGSVLRSVSSKFKNNGIEVLGIRACIATVDSYDYFNQTLLLGLKCGYLMERDVIDQICERDFYFGIVQSGIFVKNSDGDIYKAPYFRPYGNPIDRASIPASYEKLFSIGCIDRSMNLWAEIERLSQKRIFMDDLPEKINTVTENEQIIKVLRKGRNIK